MESPDVTINIPSELVKDLSEVIRMGLQRANISTNARQNLTAWWDAESDFIGDEIKAMQ